MSVVIAYFVYFSGENKN